MKRRKHAIGLFYLLLVCSQVISNTAKRGALFLTYTISPELVEWTFSTVLSSVPSKGRCSSPHVCHPVISHWLYSGLLFLPLGLFHHHFLMSSWSKNHPDYCRSFLTKLILCMMLIFAENVDETQTSLSRH